MNRPVLLSDILKKRSRANLQEGYSISELALRHIIDKGPVLFSELLNSVYGGLEYGGGQTRTLSHLLWRLQTKDKLKNGWRLVKYGRVPNTLYDIEQVEDGNSD